MSKIQKNLEKNIAGEISKEQLSKEVDIVAQEIIKQQEDKSLKNLTNPSAIALSSTKHEVGQGIERVKKTPRQLFILFLTNQFVARAVTIRADALISKGYQIVEGDDVGVKACSELIENSGGINLFSQLSTNTDIAGDGFLEKIYATSKKAIRRLKHVHPLTLAFKTNKETNKIIVDSRGEPKSYSQKYVDEKGTEQERDVPLDRISHLRFNTLGDEFTGISTIQSGYDTIVRLMNMEYSAAEAAIKTANPIIVGKCNTKSPHQIAMWGTILGRINGREQVFVPQDMELEMLSPGAQNFSEYADYFLNAIVATFGVPKALILGSSMNSGNRAEMVVLSRHFYSLIRSNQRYMEDYFNKIFKEYALLAGFKAPVLKFGDVAEDAETNAKSAIDLFTAGIISNKEARVMIGLEGEVAESKVNPSLESDIKKSDMDAFFPEAPGKKSGSQSGVKTAQKNDEFSQVKNTKE